MKPKLIADQQIVFRELFYKYYPRLIIHAKLMIDDDMTAEDIVEDSFVYLWKNMNSLEIGENISVYLFKLVQSRALNELKRQKVASGYIAQIEVSGDMRMKYMTTHNAQEIMENKELREKIDSAINSLPEKCQEVFRMSYIMDMKNKEISDITGISVRTVETHIYNALRLLRQKLSVKELIALLLLLI